MLGRGHAGAARRVASITAVRSGPHGQREHDRDLDAVVHVGAHRVADVVGVAHDVDAVDHLVGHRRERARPVARGVALAHGGDRVAVAGPLEVLRVGVDHRVAEEVAARRVDAVGAVADADMDVGVDPRVAALAHLLDRPGHVRRRAGSSAARRRRPRPPGAACPR